MIIKKFTGKTEKEATDAAKKELGDGIVIMNVRNVKKKGLAGIFGAKQTEVTVALEEEKETLGAEKKSTENAMAQAVAAARTVINAMPENAQNIEKRLDSLETLLVNRFQQDEAARSESVKQKEEEAVEEKEEKEPERQEPTEQERFIKLLYNTMLENEVDEKYANQIVDDMEKAQKPNLPFDYILADVYQKMILKFGRADGILPARKGPQGSCIHGAYRGGKNNHHRKNCQQICHGGAEEGSAFNRRYLPDCGGRAAQNLCKYTGGAFPGSLYAGGNEKGSGGFCGL